MNMNKLEIGCNKICCGVDEHSDNIKRRLLISL